MTIEDISKPELLLRIIEDLHERLDVAENYIYFLENPDKKGLPARPQIEERPKL